MATIKVKFRASSVEMKEGSLYYQVIHNRLARQVHTGYKLFPSEWDAGISEIVMDSGTEGGAQELPALREDCPSRKLVPFEKHHRTAGMFLESLSSSRPCFETINIYVSDACIVSFIHKPKSVSLAAFSSLSSKTIVVCFLHFYSLSCRCNTIRRFSNSGILRPNPALLSFLPCRLLLPCSSRMGSRRRSGA